jgi:gas vesicle protein
MSKHIHDDEEQEMENMAGNTLRVVASLLIGGLVGVGVTLLLAPQSGKRTRAAIQHKSLELREQASDSLDDAVAQVRGKTRQITSDISDKAGELQQRGHDLIDEQKERISTLRSDGKKALHNARS